MRDAPSQSSPAVDLLPRLAEIVAAAGDPDSALAAVSRAVLGYACAGDGAFELGEVQLESGDLEGARASYERAVAASPESFVAYVRLLHVLWRTNRLGEARQRFEKAALERPDDPVPACLLGMLAEHAVDRDGAVAWYRRAIKSAPACVVALNNLACLLGDAEATRAEADETARRALAAAPWCPQVLDTFAWIQHLAGRTRVGLPQIRSAAGMQPDAVETRFHEAEMLAAAGAYGDAHSAYEACLRLDPSYSDAHRVSIRMHRAARLADERR